MLLDDSVELEYNDYSASAKPLPLKWDIDLSKIWISSTLLPNRRTPINSNENKPFIFYTLEKPDENKSFSVYIDECPQYHEPQTLSAVPSEISHRKLFNNNIDKLQMQQELPSAQNAVEWDDRLDTDPVYSNKLDDSLREPQGTHNSMIRNAALWREKASNTCSMQETSTKTSFEDLTRRMAEILSEDEPLIADWRHEDIIEANHATTGSILDSIPSSTKDSLEELYYSDEDENHFDVEKYELGNLESESSEKKPKCIIYTENSYVQEQTSESFVNNLNDLDQAKNSNDKTVSKSFEKTQEIPFESRKIAVDDVFNQTEHDEMNKMETVVHSKDSEQELLSCEGKLVDPTEKIVEFPIAYKRPPLQKRTDETKPQKGKKKKKKAKKNIPLEDLFQSKQDDRFEIPEYDEFYENLVRLGKCQPQNQEIDSNVELLENLIHLRSQPSNQKTNIDEFDESHENPACGGKYQPHCQKINSDEYDEFSENLVPLGKQSFIQETNINGFLSANLPKIPQSTFFWDSAQQFIQSLGSEPQSNSPQEIIRNEEKTEPELKSKVALDTLVIDNIPLHVSKGNIENFVLGYGELKNLTIERHEKFQRAKLQMDFNCEVDWIIDCLNDSQPFGSFSTELVKCYRQT